MDCRHQAAWVSAVDANSSVATILIRVLGTARLAVAGVVLGVGAFLLLALSQASHFGWGFQFLDAAVIFAVIAHVVVFVDTVVLQLGRSVGGGQLSNMSPRRRSCAGSTLY
jgi:hypothetical protein